MTTTGAPGLRERHKQTTRRSLEDAALRLFARDGYDATTIEAIAAEVAVSPRTFFRYFTAKAEVLDMGWRERRIRLAHLVATAPPGPGDLATAVWALGEMTAGFEGERDRVQLRARAVATSATLRGRAADSTAAWERTLGEALAARRGLGRPDATARVAAAAVVAVWLTGFVEWLRDPETQLVDAVGRAFDALHDGVSNGPATTVDGDVV